MKIAVIGTGYVGLVSGACFAELGHDVICVDKDAAKIDALKKGHIPIYEPDLEKTVKENVSRRRLSFTTEIKDAVSQAEIIFLAVGTPTNPKNGSADLSWIYAAAKELGPLLPKNAVVVTKSTVPVGTARRIRAKIYKARGQRDVFIASNPEFLREGCAVKDFMEPDRILVGVGSAHAEEQLRRVYLPLTSHGVPLIVTDTDTSELTKYAANGFLATKIAYINEMADICERAGADVEVLAQGMGLDPRIGRTYLRPGPGFGGSCFPKDTLALDYISKKLGEPSALVQAVIVSNDRRKIQMAKKIIAAAGGSVKKKTVAILGLTFKANTDDMRESASLVIVPALLKAGANLRLYDPEGRKQAKKLMHLPKNTEVKWCASLKECITGADATVIVTEWNEFASLDPAQFCKLTDAPLLIDLRNLFERKRMEDAGIEYHSIGRAPVFGKKKALKRV